MIAKTKRTLLYYRRAAVPACMVALAMLQSGMAGAQQTEDSDCIFEFNKAYELAQSASQSLTDGEKFAAQSHFTTAREHYQSAIDLLQQALHQYESLPRLARDCSPTNLTIAKNNIRLARENLEWAKSAIGGLDCLQALNQVESLSNLASEYYYQQQDVTSAQQSAQDALQLVASTAADNTCRGEYADLLSEQKKNALQIANSLNERAKYDKCVARLEELTAAAQQASLAADSVTAWAAVGERAEATLDAQLCTGGYLDKLKQIKKQAQQHQQHATSPAQKH